MRVRTKVQKVVMLAGGPSAITAELEAVAGSRVLTENAISKWHLNNGIPERYWDLIRRLCRAGGFEVSPDQLHSANEEIRAGGRPAEGAAA